MYLICGTNINHLGESEDALKVEGIDFCIVSNGESHHTSKYNLMTRDSEKCLVVRRGQAFKLDILLNRTFDARTDAVSLIFNVADVDQRGPSSNTSVCVAVLAKNAENFGTWSATYEGHEDKSLMVSVTPPANCIVAAWNIEVDTKILDGGCRTYKHSLPVYVLFNPWCPDDSVYMKDPAQRDEYVLETGGLLFFANAEDIAQAPWNYAQFAKDILDCSLYLITNIGKVNWGARGDPVLTARGLAAAINVQDDNGVVTGNWSADIDGYKGGKHPTQWVGSLMILQEYYKTKQSVKYGQCWVFAGVLTTVCRCLGIPCRPVTGFDAAHDGDKSLTIDKFVDEKGNVTLNRDSIWNFHVWNEVWMQRPDLGAEYAGWQIIDSTPQERSKNIFRCGPTSLIAVLNGEIHKPYDTDYVYASVNADVVYWKKEEGKPLKLISRDTTTVGRSLSTKAIGKMEREDVTSAYKYPNLTENDQFISMNALRLSNTSISRHYLDEAFNDDVNITMELLDEVMIGQDFNVVVYVNNHSATDSHRVKGLLRVDTVTYTGGDGELVVQSEFDINIKPLNKMQVKLPITFKNYYTKLMADQGSLQMLCLATNVGHQFEYFLQDDIRMKKPDIQLSIDEEPVCGEAFNVTAKVQNPMPIPLTKCKFYIQASGLDNQLKFELENVAPGAVATASFKLTAPWTGNYQISAKFQSWEMRNVTGCLTHTIN